MQILILSTSSGRVILPVEERGQSLNLTFLVISQRIQHLVPAYIKEHHRLKIRQYTRLLRRAFRSAHHVTGRGLRFPFSASRRSLCPVILVQVLLSVRRGVLVFPSVLLDLMQILILSTSSRRVILPVEERGQSLNLPFLVIPQGVQHLVPAYIKEHHRLKIRQYTRLLRRAFRSAHHVTGRGLRFPFSVARRSLCPVILVQVLLSVRRGVLVLPSVLLDLMQILILSTSSGRVILPVEERGQSLDLPFLIYPNAFK